MWHAACNADLKLEAASDPKTHCNCRREAEMYPCLLKVKTNIRRVIAGRRKSTFYVCLIRPLLACLLQRLAKLGCPRSPVTTAQRIRFRTIGLMLFDRGHAVNVPVLGERFSMSHRFKVIDTKVNQSYRKNQFLEKSDPLTKKKRISIWKIHPDTDSHIPAKLRGNRQSRSNQTDAWYSSRERLVFYPFLWGF